MAGTRRCGSGCASWPISVAGSATGGLFYAVRRTLLRREGATVNLKRIWRLYREERLSVRRRRGRKRALGTRAPMAVPQGADQRWSLDFVSDALADGRRFRLLCVVDDFTREALATVVDTSISGARVVRELERLVAMRRLPAMVV